MNKNYKNGANFERKVAKFMEKNGYLCTRSAGSHGAIDVIAIPQYHSKHGDLPILIQCKKTGQFPLDEVEALRLADKKFMGYFLLCENNKGKPLFHDLYGEEVEI